jgi:hypothetical protein
LKLGLWSVVATLVLELAIETFVVGKSDAREMAGRAARRGDAGRERAARLDPGLPVAAALERAAARAAGSLLSAVAHPAGLGPIERLDRGGGLRSPAGPGLRREPRADPPGPAECPGKGRALEGDLVLREPGRALRRPLPGQPEVGPALSFASPPRREPRHLRVRGDTGRHRRPRRRGRRAGDLRGGAAPRRRRAPPADDAAHRHRGRLRRGLRRLPPGVRPETDGARLRPGVRGRSAAARDPRLRNGVPCRKLRRRRVAALGRKRPASDVGGSARRGGHGGAAPAGRLPLRNRRGRGGVFAVLPDLVCRGTSGRPPMAT